MTLAGIDLDSACPTFSTIIFMMLRMFSIIMITSKKCFKTRLNEQAYTTLITQKPPLHTHADIL